MVSEAKVGVVGLGNMGAALAERLLDLVAEVVVFDVRGEAIEAAVAKGAVAGRSALDVAERVDALITALPSTRVSLEVAQEVSECRDLRAYIETSTVGPTVMREIAETLSVPVIDAPLSGGPRGILRGNLASYLSGPSETRREISSWFDALCTRRIEVGEHPGAAQIGKLVNNAISLSGMAIASEAIAVGVAAGIDPKTVVAAVNAGTGRNSATADKFPSSVLTGTFDFGGPVFLAEKDLELYQSLGREVGVTESLTEPALEAFREAILRFGVNADYTEIARVFESAVSAEIRDRPVAAHAAAGNGWRSEHLD